MNGPTQGKDWLLTTVNDAFGNQLEKYYAVELGGNEESEMYFEDMVPRPDAGVACLSFRYKKYLKGKKGEHSQSAISRLELCLFLFQKNHGSDSLAVFRNLSEMG